MPTKENEVFNVNFLDKSTRKSELIGKLKELHEALGGLSQDPRERPLKLSSTAAELVSDRILGNPDKEVRLLGSCCIVDILRIFAPEAPYDDPTLVKIFKVIIAQLRGLATYDNNSTATGAKIFYILSSLSVVKSCVVLVYVAQSGVPGADELYANFFEVRI